VHAAVTLPHHNGGTEGVGLLDAWAGDHDRASADTRLAEIRRLLDDEKLRLTGCRRAGVAGRPASV